MALNGPGAGGTGGGRWRVQKAAEGQVTEDSADVLQPSDLPGPERTGPNEVTIEVQGETGLMYQGVGRHYEPHKAEPPAKPVLEVVMDYDRTSLSTADVLRAKATVKYAGKEPTYMVLVGLPVPPGFTVDAGELAELVGAKRIQKFSVTARQVTLYLGGVRPGSAQAFEYSLRPKYPVRAKAPAAVAYEYHTPAHRAARPAHSVAAAWRSPRRSPPRRRRRRPGPERSPGRA
jgi:hypothetical protein